MRRLTTTPLWRRKTVSETAITLKLPPVGTRRGLGGVPRDVADVFATAVLSAVVVLVVAPSPVPGSTAVAQPEPSPSAVRSSTVPRLTRSTTSGVSARAGPAQSSTASPTSTHRNHRNIPPS